MVELGDLVSGVRDALKRMGLDVIFFVIWALTLLLLVVEIFHRRLISQSFFVILVETVIDVLALFDIYRRAKTNRNCNEYLSNIWNWLDLLTIWFVLIHWILFYIEPVFQIISDAWLAIRYSVVLYRFGWWTITGRRAYKKYQRISTQDLDTAELVPNAFMDGDDDEDHGDVHTSRRSSSDVGSSRSIGIGGVGALEIEMIEMAHDDDG
mmetsp:Transcript_4088/g.7546  ORF Transcript_4088/g.7546 Transcript_4088/m.7546 type:complete len:209 (-) Transcript_4088:96-722(-)